MRAFDGAFRIENAVIGEDRHRHTPDMREAADKRGAVKGFELMELRAIDQPGNDLFHIVRCTKV